MLHRLLLAVLLCGSLLFPLTIGANARLYSCPILPLSAAYYHGQVIEWHAQKWILSIAGDVYNPSIVTPIGLSPQIVTHQADDSWLLVCNTVITDTMTAQKIVDSSHKKCHRYSAKNAFACKK